MTPHIQRVIKKYIFKIKQTKFICFFLIHIKLRFLNRLFLNTLKVFVLKKYVYASNLNVVCAKSMAPVSVSWS